MILTFDEEQHRYTLDGLPAPSVTGILRRVGLINFDSVPPSILEAARRRGTLVHRALHYFNENDLNVAEFRATLPELAGYLDSWLALRAAARFETCLCEHRIACVAPRFVGTFDWLGLFNGRATLLDYATGDPEDGAKHLQTAGYVLGAQMWSQQPDQQVLADFIARYPHIDRYSVRLSRTGALPVLTPYRDPLDFIKFRTLAQSVAIVESERARLVPWNWQEH